MSIEEERRKWLEGLKEGDAVGISCGYSHRTWTRETVSRTTAKQVIIGNQRFWRKNGQLVGASGYMIVELIPLGPRRGNA